MEKDVVEIHFMIYWVILGWNPKPSMSIDSTVPVELNRVKKLRMVSDGIYELEIIGLFWLANRKLDNGRRVIRYTIRFVHDLPFIRLQTLFIRYICTLVSKRAHKGKSFLVYIGSKDRGWVIHGGLGNEFVFWMFGSGGFLGCRALCGVGSDGIVGRQRERSRGSTAGGRQREKRWVYGGATMAFPDRVCGDRVGLAGQQRRGKNCELELVVVDGAVQEQKGNVLEVAKITTFKYPLDLRPKNKACEQSRSFENSYIPENPRTPKPLTFSKNRLRGAKNRSNISPVAKKNFRKNDFFFSQKLCICANFFFVHMCTRIVMIKNVLEGSEVGFFKGITLGSFENSYIPENSRTPPISYISQTVIPFKKPTSGLFKTSFKREQLLNLRTREQIWATYFFGRTQEFIEVVA
ncbi:hypothetical protein LXL04_022816 [Taraxacum kok-saghyz]